MRKSAPAPASQEASAATAGDTPVPEGAVTAPVPQASVAEGEASPYYGLLPDTGIARYAQTHRMIDPFVDRLVRDENGKKVISYGLSSYGYDLRLADPIALVDAADPVVDPKQGDTSLRLRYLELPEGRESLLIPPRGMALARSVEYLRFPPTVLGLVIGKSTYSRAGLLLNATACEPGWEGHLTIQLVNTTHRPLAVYPHEGICQVLFFEAKPCSVTYADRAGKYQASQGIALPRA